MVFIDKLVHVEICFHFYLGILCNQNLLFLGTGTIFPLFPFIYNKEIRCYAAFVITNIAIHFLGRNTIKAFYSNIYQFSLFLVCFITGLYFAVFHLLYVYKMFKFLALKGNIKYKRTKNE